MQGKGKWAAVQYEILSFCRRADMYFRAAKPTGVMAFGRLQKPFQLVGHSFWPHARVLRYECMNDARAGLACFFIDRAFNFRLQAPAFNSQILEKSSSEPQWMMVFWMWPCAPTLGGRWVRVEFSPAPLTFVGVRMLHDNQPVVGDSREKNSNNRQYWQTIQVKHYFWTFAWLVQKISSYVGREYK